MIVKHCLYYKGREKEYSKNNQLINWLGYRLDHKLSLDHLVIYCFNNKI